MLSPGKWLFFRCLFFGYSPLWSVGTSHWHFMSPTTYLPAHFVAYELVLRRAVGKVSGGRKDREALSGMRTSAVVRGTRALKLSSFLRSTMTPSPQVDIPPRFKQFGSIPHSSCCLPVCSWKIREHCSSREVPQISLWDRGVWFRGTSCAFSFGLARSHSHKRRGSQCLRRLSLHCGSQTLKT